MNKLGRRAIYTNIGNHCYLLFLFISYKIAAYIADLAKGNPGVQIRENPMLKADIQTFKLCTKHNKCSMYCL